eukprot:gene7512-8346_t
MTGFHLGKQMFTTGSCVSPAEIWYCNEKLAYLRAEKIHRRSEGPKTNNDNSNIKASTGAKSRVDSKQKNAEVPKAFGLKIEELKIKSLIAHLEKINAGPRQHSVSHCRNCRERKVNVKTCDFIRRKLQIVQEEEVNRRYCEHMTEKTSALLIADIIKQSKKKADNKK